jgi:hypothetical protein
MRLIQPKRLRGIEVFRSGVSFVPGLRWVKFAYSSELALVCMEPAPTEGQKNPCQPAHCGKALALTIHPVFSHLAKWLDGGPGDPNRPPECRVAPADCDVGTAHADAQAAGPGSREVDGQTREDVNPAIKAERSPRALNSSVLSSSVWG